VHKIVYVILVARHRAIKIVVALNSFNKRIEKRILERKKCYVYCVCMNMILFITLIKYLSVIL